MASRSVSADLSVTGKVTQTGTPSAGGDLATKTYVDTEVATRQASSTDLTDLIARWVAASASGPASLEFAEDTDNGSNKITLIGQSTLGGDFVVTLPGVTGTVYVTGGTDVAIADGGTGVSTLPTGLLKGAGVGAITAATAGTDYYAPSGTDVAVADGGTGRSTSTTAYALIAAGTTPTGAHQTLAAGATTEVLVGGGASALPTWTTATGTGAPVRATSPTLVTPLLGTPTSGVLTNCTGLPLSSVVDSTSEALGVGTIELGHASDTTIARVSAGRISVEGVNVPTISSTDTLTNKTLGTGTVLPVHIAVALSDLTTDLVAGQGKEVLHLPYAMTLTQVYAEVATVSSSGVITVDINEGAGSGTTVLSTKLTIDASEETSGTAAAAAVISDSALAANARLTFDIDTAGTGARGLKVHLLGTRTI